MGGECACDGQSYCCLDHDHAIVFHFGAGDIGELYSFTTLPAMVCFCGWYFHRLGTFPAEFQAQIDVAVSLRRSSPVILSYAPRAAIMDRGQKRPNKMPSADDGRLPDSDSEATPREQPCDKKVCPWCILGIEHHAAVTAAAEAWQREHELFTNAEINPWRYWISSCAWNWIWTMHSVQIQPPARTLADQGIWGVTASDDQASVQPPPPPSSLVASMHGSMTEASKLARLAKTERSADARSSSSSLRATDVAQAGVFPVAVGWSAGFLEYYGGKNTGWKAYPADVQETLRQAVREGVEVVEVTCAGKAYNICLVTMQQRRRGLEGGNARAVRWNRTGALVRNVMAAYSWPFYFE
jgi:hypothetical protein